MSSLSYSQLRSANEARVSEEARQELQTRNILLLMMHHLQEEGYTESARCLERESGLSLNRYQICDNIDLPTILQEFEAYYRIKFNRQPKISKKAISQSSSQEDHSQNKYRRTTRVTQHLPRIVQDAYEAVANGNIPGPIPQNPRPSANTLPRPFKSANRPNPQEQQTHGVDIGLTAMQVNYPPAQQQQQAFHCVKGKQIVNVRDILTNAIGDGDPSRGGPITNVNSEDRLLKPAGGISGYSSDMKELAAVISRDIHLQNPDVRWDDIVGLDTPKQLIKEAVVYPIKYPELFRGILSPWKGLLLFGPPGTGKTMLAKAVATECRTTFFNISASSIVSKWRGDSEKLVRVLFELARFHAPSTIFLDELESIMSQRGSSGGVSEHEGSRRMKTELLIQMDGLAKSEDLVFVLAASNLPWELDRAMLRRLEKRIMVGLPNEEAREAMLRQFLPPEIVPPPVLIRSELDYKQLARQMEGYSGSDLKLVSKEAVMMRLRKVFDQLEELTEEDSHRGWQQLSIDPVLTSDVERALSRTKPSVHNLTKSYLDWQNEFESV
ncbi:Katanin p60 ATPase-containing subunit A-like 2 isoform X2 [Oopsacas minuta]|uniref:Katanin p60 ATPase-containing subunit A-like 2 n=1 Tax=Oopsacas minuta TaxID=111878 RepID=A0AAV7KGC2_9METZ|nr:Katanin p60 ATPase-containing subunit A-like 2 isoform X2 [Oopsacas minuta]